MTDRITQQNLEGLCNRLNQITGSPLESYVDRKAQIGNYHLSYAYSGVSLHRMHNESGGVQDVLYCGHVPKRELWNRIQGFIKGIESTLPTLD